MATQVPPKKNSAFVFTWALVSQADSNLFQVNPTLATGDVKIEIDNGSASNITSLPTVLNSGTTIYVSLTAAEMNGDNITVKFHDAAGAEWADVTINIQTVARQIDDLTYPTVSGRSLDVTATGEAGVDWANIGSPTTTVNLSGTTVKTATDIATQITALLTTAVADSLPADGSRPSVAQGILWLTRFLGERSVSGLTMTVKKEDGSTSAMTFTLDDSLNPTSITRAS